MEAAAPARELLIRAAADLHGELPAVQPCDLLLLVGDLVPYELERDHDRSREWLTTTFADWTKQIPATQIIGVAGNHDLWATAVPEGVHPDLYGARWTYLRDAEINAQGLRVYGSPWTPDVYKSAFEAPGSRLTQIWNAIPAGLDILAVHCPPRGHGDLIGAHSGEPRPMGSEELTQAIARTRPRLVLYGHAHEGYGYRAELPSGPQLANVTLRTDYGQGMHSVSEFRLTTS
ncbi:MAG: metallophosphoesterase [Solirubrobacterales bacterium]|nr:metallophosphoesterase [Solirubrobacterales bacterium]